MQLIKEIWKQEDLISFREYLYSFSKGKEKSKWEKKIVNTSLKCIAVPSKEINNIVKQIYKGNFNSFINLWPWENHSEVLIIGNLICKIDEFDDFKLLLKKYAQKIDNWSACDCLKFNITNKNKHVFFKLSKELLLNRLPFVRRVGLLILLKMLKYKEFLTEIFNILNSFTNEKEYYVNMIIAWIVCEAFIKYKEETITFLYDNNLNKFTLNKAISKCRDSFRVSKQDKEFLIKFRRKED